MRYKIGQKCIQCFACIRNRICPEEAIIERNEIYSIDNAKCTDCGICYAGQEYFCPVRAFIEIEASVRPQEALLRLQFAGLRRKPRRSRRNIAILKLSFKPPEPYFYVVSAGNRD